MDFGVNLSALKKLAAKPPLKPLFTKLGTTKGIQVEWLGASFKNVETLGERSGAGLHDNNGALLIDLPKASLASKNSLQKGDVIIRLGDKMIGSISDLLQAYQMLKWMGVVDCVLIRNQGEHQLKIAFK